MSTWKYTKNGQQLGPVDTEALLSMLRTGTLTLETTVCQEGKTDWVPMRTLPEFSGAASPGAAPRFAPPLSGSASPLEDGETPDAADVDKNKIFAVLAYLGILVLVPLLAAKESRFARYHANQGVVLCLAAIVCWVAAFILSFILAFVPFLRFLGCFIWLPVWGGILVLMVMGIINAAGGQCKPLPLIGQFKLIK